MKKIIWIPLIILIAWLPFIIGAWDNDKPADNQAWNDAAGSIRDNWDAIEAVFGVDLVDASVGVSESIFNVKNSAYGAEGDGSTDDSTAINAAGTALNAAGGGTMFFPEGTFIIDAAIIIYSNMRVTGAAGAILKTKASTQINIFNVASRDNVVIDHLKFDGNQTNQADAGNGTIQNCIYITSGTNITVHDCDFVNIVIFAIQGVGPKYSRFTNNYIKTATGAENGGIQLHFNTTPSPTVIPEYNVIANNYIEDCDGGGIHVRGAHHTTVIGNIIYDSGTNNAIILYVGDEDDGCEDNTVVGNIIDGAGTGILVAALTAIPIGNNLSGNIIANTSVIGINYGGVDGTISNNVMVDGIAGAGGIKLNASEDVIVTGNRINAGACTYGAIDIRGEYTTVIGNNCEGSTVGIHISSGGTYDNQIIVYNNLRDTTNGLYINSGANHTIQGNDFTGSNTPITWGGSAGAALHIEGNTGIAIPSLADDATPQVIKGNTYLTGGTTTITDFDDGYEGQVITVIGAHTLTITDGTHIILDGGANMSMTSGDVLNLVQLADTKWYQISEANNN